MFYVFKDAKDKESLGEANIDEIVLGRLTVEERTETIFFFFAPANLRYKC